MKIVVFLKQIPEVNRIELDPNTMRIRRDGVPLMANPFDMRAVEEALRLKEKTGCSVIAASMGPPQARAVVEHAVRMGCDEGYLITDRAYAGADTLITSRVLAAFAKMHSPELILMGKYSLDGETGQVPAEIATMLGFNHRSAASKIELQGNTVHMEQEHESGFHTFEIPLPAVLSVGEKINRPRAPAAQSAERVYEIGESEIKSGCSGSASPTVVEGVTAMSSLRNVTFLSPGEETFRLLLSLSEEKEALEPLSLISGRGPKEIWGVAVGDAGVASEISSRAAELANANMLSVAMIGNVDPEGIECLHCDEYVLVKGGGTDGLAAVMLSKIRERRPEYILFPSNTEGREIAGKIAAELGLGLTADCVDVDIREGRLVQFKPAFGGGIVARIVSRTSPQMATVRPGMFRKRSGHEAGKIREMVAEEGPIAHTGFSPVPSTFAPLGSSRAVIGVGRGIRKKEELAPILELAQLMGAAVGGTRPIVDYGFLPRQQQIGLTGRAISPSLYIALGVSGQDNHIVGIRYAKHVVAVNSNRDAPIFRHADYGLVMDLFEFTEQMKQFLLKQQVRASL